MNDQENCEDEGQNEEEKAKKLLEEMFAGFRKLVDNMSEVAEGMKAAQMRHASTLAGLGKHQMETARGELVPLLEAILDITSSMASAQILHMEAGQQQITLSMKQMAGLASLEGM